MPALSDLNQADRAAFTAAGLREPIAIGTTTEGNDVTLEGQPLDGGWEHELR